MKALSSINLSFGLLTLPIKVYPLRNSKEDKISFSSLSNCCHKETGLQRYCKECAGKQDWRTDLKGFKVGKNNFIELTTEELNTIDDLENGIEIIKFCSVASVPYKVLDKPYLIEPTDSRSVKKLYSLFNSAFAELNVCAVAKTIIKGNEHFSILRHDKEWLILQFVERTSEITAIPNADFSEAEREQIKTLISNNMAEFSFDFYEPVYVTKVRQMIEAKMEGKPIEVKEMNTKLNENALVLDMLKKMNEPKALEVVR